MPNFGSAAAAMIFGALATVIFGAWMIVLPTIGLLWLLGWLA